MLHALIKIGPLCLLMSALLFWQCAEDDFVPPDVPEEEDTTALTPYPLPDIPHFSDFPAHGNRPTMEGVELGRRLYFDPILSSDYTIACTDCHRQAFSFGDNQSVSGGVNDVPGIRNAPPLINMAWFHAYNWDGKFPHVRDQNKAPVPSELEMNLPWGEAAQRLREHPDYPALFEEVFPGQPIDSNLITRALEQFQLIMISYESPYDAFQTGTGTLSPPELRGFNLFRSTRLGCFRCHDVENSPELFITDRVGFANNGLDSVPPPMIFTDAGRGGVTGRSEDAGKFRIPTLRNLGYTAPFMHDGRFNSLDEVIDMYNRGPAPSPTVDPLMLADAQARLNTTGVWGMQLTDNEKADLKAFLLSMTDDGFTTDPEFQEP